MNGLINLVDETLKGELDLSFKEFDISEIEKIQEKYAKEAYNLYCNKNEYKEYIEKTAQYNKDNWTQIGNEINRIFKGFADIMDKGVDSKETQNLVNEWKEYISENLYECTNTTLKELGKMYVEDERFKKNIDKHKKGLAEFINKAIIFYCK